MAHDPCRNTGSKFILFHFFRLYLRNRNQSIFYLKKKLLTDKFSLGAGQNIAYIGAYPNEPSTNDGIRGGVLGWYNEYKDTAMSDIRSLNRIYTNE